MPRWTQPDALGRAASSTGSPGDEPTGRSSAGRGPGPGAAGVPRAIALTPILSARYRAADLERIRAAAPGARIVTVSLEGLADGALDDVEVMLRGRLPRRSSTASWSARPRLRWVHSATAGVERVLTPAARERGMVITNARGVFCARSPSTC